MDIDATGRRRDYDLGLDFPVEVERVVYPQAGPIFASHWHEHFQILSFEQGQALIYCNSRPSRVGPGELMIINCNDVHYGENLGDTLVYAIIKVDIHFLLSSQVDLCQSKYLAPLLQNRILFRSHVRQDEELSAAVSRLVAEFDRRELGYELAVKADMYHVLVLLLRRHVVKTIGVAEQERQRWTRELLRPVLAYMDQNFREPINLERLSDMASLSRHHFCRVFKGFTGKSPLAYLNYLRINAATELLLDSDRSITEIALSVGFNDSNYFSRIYRKYRQTAPSEVRLPARAPQNPK